MLVSAKYQHESAIGLHTSGASRVAQLVKSLPAMWVGKIPGLGRSPGGGYGNPFHTWIGIPYMDSPCLENPMDRGAWEAMDHGDAKSQT